MLQPDHQSPEAQGQEGPNLDLEPDQEIETRENEKDQHHPNNSAVIPKENSIKTRYFLLWLTVYRMIVAKTTSANILNSLVKLVIVLYLNSGIQEGAGVLDSLDMLRRLMRNMQLKKLEKIQL